MSEMSTDDAMDVDDPTRSISIPVIRTFVKDYLRSQSIDGLNPKWLFLVQDSRRFERIYQQQPESFRTLVVNCIMLICDEKDLILSSHWAEDPFKYIKEEQGSLPERTTVFTFNLTEIERAWNQPYEGDAAKDLFNTIKCAKWDKRYLQNSVSLVQASACGKSRTADEVRKLVFTVPFNLRDEEESFYHAYPPPDHKVRYYLTTVPINEAEVRFVLFFGVLFNELIELFEGKKYTPDDWKKYPDEVPSGASFSNRDKLNTSVCNKARDKAKHSQDLETVVRNANESLERLLKLIKQLDVPQVEEPPDLKPEGTKDNDVPIRLLITFDEVQTLTKSKRYIDLLSAFNNFRDFPVFVLCLSTVSNLYTVAPKSSLIRSARSGAELSPAPITITPFDCSPVLTKRIEFGILNLEKVTKYRFMAQFGRPLYWTLFGQEVKDEQDFRKGERIVRLLQKKLMRSDQIDRGAAAKSTAALSVLDVRLRLDYKQNSEVDETLADMVANHMRIAYTVPETRAYILSGYPSEPMLGEAALEQLAGWRKSDKNVMFNILKERLVDPFIDRGERGELLGRALLSEAYDRALGGHTNRSYGCSVTDLLSHLVTDSAKVLDGQADNANLKISDAFKKSWIRMNQWVLAIDDSVLTREALTAAFIRGHGIICRPGETMIDLLVPILIDKAGRISPDNMSFMMVQIKPRYREEIYELGIDKHATQHFNFGDRVPYLAILMDLGVINLKNVLPKSNVVDQDVVPAANLLPADVVQKTKSLVEATVHDPTLQVDESRKGPDCFTICLQGFNSQTFKVLETVEEATIDVLLDYHDKIIVDHPRPYRFNLSRVLNFKPFLRLGSESYDWCENDLLNKRK